MCRRAVQGRPPAVASRRGQPRAQPMDELTQVTLALGLAALCRPTEPHVRETAADVRSQPSPPLNLLQLPDECLALVLQHAGASEDAALALPRVCKALRANRTVQSLCLAARVRLIARAACPERGLSEWATGHAWAALNALHTFLDVDVSEARQRAAAIDVAPRTRPALESLLSAACQGRETAAALASAPAASAEDLFSASYAREHGGRQRALLDRTCTGDRHVLRDEAERQMRRQLDAGGRRSWRLLSGGERAEWGRRAEEARVHRARCAHTATEAANLAAAVRRRLAQIEAADGAEDIIDSAHCSGGAPGDIHNAAWAPPACAPTGVGACAGREVPCVD